MLAVSSLHTPEGAGRPLVAGLFVASALLSVVSWYTTWQGMALYLAAWFAALASLGIQTALVLVAWLIGFTKAKRGLLVVVYVITALVSIGFSYVSLYTWFSARERPAAVSRRLYDSLNDAGGRTQELLAAAVAEGRKHVLALDEMTAAEKTHGYIARAQDADPYLAAVRDAVAREAQTYSSSYREGSGEGLRYTAFDRYSKLARQSLTDMQATQVALADFRSQLKPLDPTEKQLRAFRQVFDSVPWGEVEKSLHAGRFERPAIPAYSDFVDRTVSGQEDLMVAFQELFTNPSGRHVFSLALAGFIDVVVFLLAYASGPYFFGSPEQRWLAAAAALDGVDDQVLARNFLRKLGSSPQGMARVAEAELSAGERQFCLLLAAKRLAVQQEGGYLLDEAVHERLVESLAVRRLPLRAAAVQA
jgi:hypothetical protein